MARLCAVYGLSPDAIFHMPRWQLAILAEQLAAIEAHTTRQRVNAAIAPHIDKNDRRDWLKRLDRLADGPPPPPPEIPKVAYDPQKAAEWLAAQGIQVVHE